MGEGQQWLGGGAGSGEGAEAVAGEAAVMEEAVLAGSDGKGSVWGQVLGGKGTGVCKLQGDR